MFNNSLKYSLFLFSMVIAIVSSCSVNEDIPNMEFDSRVVFIDGKTDLEIKEEFLKLEFEEQKNLWKSKLNQILETAVDQNQRNYINILISEFEKSNSIQDLKSSKIQVIAIEIAKITSKEDLISMFTNLRNFEPSHPSAFEICEDCLESLVNDWDNIEPIFENNGRMMAKCNCKWTCNINFTTMDNKVTTDCASTNLGCGFLLLQSCNKRSDLV